MIRLLAQNVKHNSAQNCRAAAKCSKSKTITPQGVDKEIGRCYNESKNSGVITLEDKNAKLSKAALEIINLARGTLAVNLRFLASAIRALNAEEYDGTIYTDGETVFYNPRYTAAMYRLSKELPVRCYLHLLMHCIFRHNFIEPTVNPRLWDLACDIAAENVINGLKLGCVRIDREAEQNRAIEKISESVPLLTAEKLYSLLCSGNFDEELLDSWEKLFQIDDHSQWYAPKTYRQDSGKSADTRSGDNGERVSMQPCEANRQKTGGESEYGGRGSSDGSSRAALEKMWENISRNIQTDLETFSKQRGDSAGALMMNLNSVNRERYDYESFLKKFAVPGEAMKINEDEFDYIFYTYGMEHYNRMPFIEPLEYKEVKRIRDFVIALDTSGSVSQIVKKFVQKTYNILMQEESYFSRINLHIIQCDAEIQEDVRITSKEELEQYINRMEIKGFGGTDFRPVFRRVDELAASGELANLEGMIYFTDGYGTFPQRQPQYKTAVVYLDDGYNNPDVPPWAIKIVLQSNEI
ncbi:MAG: VWA-like domain-containing protein [Oscillospiraceae bacterium]